MAITVTDYQPDDTIAIDTYISQENPTTNYGTSGDLVVGHWLSASQKYSTLIRFDWMWNGAGVNCPGNKKFKLMSGLELKLYTTSISSYPAYCPKIYFIKRDWVENQVTWNIWKTGSNWTTAGAIHADDSLDTEHTDYGRAAGTWWMFWVPTELIIKSMTGEYFGLMIGVNAGPGYNYISFFASSSNATAANRPKYSFSYERYHKVFPISAGLGQVR